SCSPSVTPKNRRAASAIASYGWSTSKIRFIACLLDARRSRLASPREGYRTLGREPEGAVRRLNLISKPRNIDGETAEGERGRRPAAATPSVRSSRRAPQRF